MRWPDKESSSCCHAAFCIVKAARLPPNHCSIQLSNKERNSSKIPCTFCKFTYLAFRMLRKIDCKQQETIPSRRLERTTRTHSLLRTRDILSPFTNNAPAFHLPQARPSNRATLTTNQPKVKTTRCRLQDSLTVSALLSTSSTTCCRHTCHYKWTGRSDR